MTMTILFVTTKPASTASRTAIAMVPAPASTTANAAGVLNSKTMTGKTRMVTNTGWEIAGTTNRPIAKATNAGIGAPTVTMTTTEIAMTTAGAITTGDRRVRTSSGPTLNVAHSATLGWGF